MNIEAKTTCEHKSIEHDGDYDDVDEIVSTHQEEDSQCDCDQSEITFDVTFRDGDKHVSYDDVDSDELNEIMEHDYGDEIMLANDNWGNCMEYIANGRKYKSGEAYAQYRYEDEDIDHILFNAVDWGAVWGQFASGISWIELSDCIYVL